MRPLQVLFGYANDVYGQKAFAQLDKQMIHWWRQNYGSSGAQQAQASMQAPRRAERSFGLFPA